MTSVPSVDPSDLGIEADTPPELQAMASLTEQNVLLRHLGLQAADLDTDVWQAPERRRLMDQIAHHIVTNTTFTRRSITEAELSGLLDPAVERALATVEHLPATTARRESVSRALMQAIYETLPKDLLHAMIETQITNAYPAGVDRNAAQNFYAKLREGNGANDMSAGMAVLMAMEDNPTTPSTWNATYLSVGNRATVQAAIGSLQEQKGLYESVHSLRSESVLFNYQHPGVDTYADAIAEHQALRQDEGHAISGSVNPWFSSAMRTVYAAETPNTLTTADEKKAKVLAAKAFQQDLREDLGSYVKVVRLLEALLTKAQALFVNPAVALPDLYKYFNAGTIDPTQIRRTLTTAVIESEITANLAIIPAPVLRAGGSLTAEADIPARITQEQANLAGIKEEKDISGVEAQMSVFRRYIQNRQPSLSDADVNKVATYVSHRTKVDGILRGSVDTAMDEYLSVADRTAGESLSNYWHGNRHAQTIDQIARSFNIGLRAGQQPSWELGSYEQVSGAYFAIKELVDGKGPEGLRMTGRPAVAIENMRTLSRILTTRYAGQMEQRLVQSLPDAEKKKVLESRTHLAQAVKNMLTGDTPSWSAATVKRAHERADKRVQWARRSVYALPKNTWNVGSAAVSKVGSWIGGAAKAVTNSEGFLAKYGKDAATIAAWSLIGTPALGLAVWYAGKSFAAPAK